MSESTGRHKPVVLFSSLVIAVGLALIATAHSYLAFAAALMVCGFGEGLYLSVDVARAAEVLPNPEESAKDMGVLNIGNALPQSLVPITAPTLLAIGGGGNYGALFLFGGRGGSGRGQWAVHDLLFTWAEAPGPRMDMPTPRAGPSRHHGSVAGLRAARVLWRGRDRGVSTSRRGRDLLAH